MTDALPLLSYAPPTDDQNSTAAAALPPKSWFK